MFKFHNRKNPNSTFGRILTSRVAASTSVTIENLEAIFRANCQTAETCHEQNRINPCLPTKSQNKPIAQHEFLALM